MPLFVEEERRSQKPGLRFRCGVGPVRRALEVVIGVEVTGVVGTDEGRNAEKDADDVGVIIGGATCVVRGVVGCGMAAIIGTKVAGAGGEEGGRVEEGTETREDRPKSGVLGRSSASAKSSIWETSCEYSEMSSGIENLTRFGCALGPSLELRLRPEVRKILRV